MSRRWDYTGVLQNTNAINDNNTIDKMMSQRNTTRLSERWDLSNHLSIVGMDATKVGAAIQAIDEYVQRLETKSRQINENAKIDQALKGDMIQTSVRNYIEKVEEYCVNLCSQLRFFRDRLQGASDAWQMHAENIAQNIATDTGSFDAGVHKQ